jgi:hypothetical protein
MSTIEHQIAQLTRAVQDLASQMSPWISTQEMCKRYDCTPKTLNAMERRGDIPWRVKGRWNRAEVIEWEARQAA